MTVATVSKAIILAAGLGSRLDPLTKDIPKCLVRVQGKPLLRNTLEKLERAGIEETVILVGYLANVVRKEIGSHLGRMKITYIESERYKETNNMYSLWLAREYLEQGAVLLEGDVIFDEKILTKALNDERSLWIVDRFTEGMDGSMSTTDSKGKITEIQIIRQTLPAYKDNFHKSVGILKLTPEYGQSFSKWLDEDVQAGKVSLYYDLVLQPRLDQQPLYVCSIDNLKWFEIDTYEDLQKAEKLFGGDAGMKYEIVPISRLKPLEMVFPSHLKNLNDMILQDGIVKLPLLVDQKTGTVLDGSHRYVFFLMHGYKTAPVRWVDYDSEDVRVGTHLTHRHIIEGPTNISKKEVRERGLNGNIYPPRTTRHFFPFRKTDEVHVPLSSLEKGEPVDVKNLIATVDVDYEIHHNRKFIQEIEDEIDELIRYLDEVRQTKKYLKKQIEGMERRMREGSSKNH